MVLWCCAAQALFKSKDEQGVGRSLKRALSSQQKVSDPGDLEQSVSPDAFTLLCLVCIAELSEVARCICE